MPWKERPESYIFRFYRSKSVSQVLYLNAMTYVEWSFKQSLPVTEMLFFFELFIAFLNNLQIPLCSHSIWSSKRYQEFWGIKTPQKYLRSLRNLPGVFGRFFFFLAFFQSSFSLNSSLNTLWQELPPLDKRCVSAFHPRPQFYNKLGKWKIQMTLVFINCFKFI